MIKIFVLFATILFLSSACIQQEKGLYYKEAVRLPAFPGAEGFGTITQGGRGGKVLEVTNLNDSGPGSLREAVEDTGPRTVVFRVSGNIELRSTLTIINDSITIAGQTAPGDGICLKDRGCEVYANEVIIRFIRSRPGDGMVDGERYASDAISGRSCKNIILDHCSMSWGMDETNTFYHVENYTVQWSIISENLYDSYHPKGPHGMGWVVSGVGATAHHNLCANNATRNPRFSPTDFYDDSRIITDFRNNVIYNWGSSHNPANC